MIEKQSGINYNVLYLLQIILYKKHFRLSPINVECRLGQNKYLKGFNKPKFSPSIVTESATD